MKSSGNSNAGVCVSNLCRLVRGEVPGDRCRGVDGRLLERHNITSELIEDIKWLISEYEPRVDTESVEISAESSDDGAFYIDVISNRKKE